MRGNALQLSSPTNTVQHFSYPDEMTFTAISGKYPPSTANLRLGKEHSCRGSTKGSNLGPAFGVDQIDAASRFSSTSVAAAPWIALHVLRRDRTTTVRDSSTLLRGGPVVPSEFAPP